jgi:hypothetical protein
MPSGGVYPKAVAAGVALPLSGTGSRVGIRLEMVEK